MTVFNKDNKGYITKKYPLFLGEDLGLFDTINLTYPKLEELYQLQVSQIWNEFEIDVSQDRMDMMTVPKETTDLMVKTISWQHLADSIAAKSVSGLLMPHITNSELEGLVSVWAFFECIHSRTYSHIVKQTFKDPNEMLQGTYDDLEVLVRSEAIAGAFNELEALPKDATKKEKQVALVKAITALFALEGIAFMSSFAVTFGITETGVFQGIGQLVKLICRDEVLHTRMDYEVINILKNDPEWLEVITENVGSIKVILDSVVDQELAWSEHLFSEGRQVVGLNSNLLKEYVVYMAQPLYKFLGVDFDYEVVNKNPLPYMDKYIDSSKMQAAAQEIQLTSYNVGAIEDDTDGLDLDWY